MKGSSQPRRPRLLALVYGASLALVALTLAGVLVVVNEHLRSAAVNAMTASDHAVVAGFLRGTLRADELESGVEAGREAVIAGELSNFTERHDLLGAAIRNPHGERLYGDANAWSPALLSAAIVDAARSGRATTSVLEPGSILVEHLPVVDDAGALRAIVTLERDATGVLAAASAAAGDIVAIFGVGAAVLAMVLLLIFRAAQQLLTRRTEELIEASRRDTLTGLRNHGTVVGVLTDTLEAARREGGWVIVALVDVDGFRLLNETHGYAAGDRVLRFIAEVLRTELPDGAIAGRAGPDEFLIIGPPWRAPDVRPAVDRVRARLARSPFRFDGAEHLAVTVSVGIASYPEHAASVSELLAVAGLMLADARTGGGNRVRVDAPEIGAEPRRWSAFSVLDGLVEAVDAKDHYTRRHSEQVATYASMLAERLSMDPAALQRVRLAALLHDVGKIAVPDVILRKPGPLTDEEREVIQQHPVLGDAIVGSLPGFEGIALGIRHHHERWDGSGYPDGLCGEAIPRLARIVSLADAYSAMTTHRTYRSRLTTTEARRRIVTGQGAQFDPTLTAEFIAILETMADDELPLDEGVAPGTDIAGDKETVAA